MDPQKLKMSLQVRVHDILQQVYKARKTGPLESALPGARHMLQTKLFPAYAFFPSC